MLVCHIYINKNFENTMLRYVLIFLMFVPSALTAQEKDLFFTHMKPGNTRPQNHIQVIFQDSRGFLWFGTEAGLYRYDGINIKNFHGNPWKNKNIGSAEIYTITEGSSQKLWIGTKDGLFNYDPVLEKFSKFIFIPDDNNILSSNHITVLKKDSFGTLWIGTYDGGLNKLVINKENGKDTENYSFTAYKNIPGDPESISCDTINVIIEDKDELLWIGTDSGLNIFDRKTQKFRNSNNDPL